MSLQLFAGLLAGNTFVSEITHNMLMQMILVIFSMCIFVRLFLGLNVFCMVLCFVFLYMCCL